MASSEMNVFGASLGTTQGNVSCKTLTATAGAAVSGGALTCAALTASGLVSANAGVNITGTLAVTGSAVVTGTISGAWLRAGQATILAGQQSIAVANAGITATSVVVATISGAAADGTLTYITRVAMNAGIGFTIFGDAVSTGPVDVSWAILAF